MEKIIPICENRDYRRIYSRGKSVVTPQIVIYIFKNRLNKKRVGITTGKKIGNAVKRNRARRIIREAVRALLPEMRSGFDIILVARGKTPYHKSTDIKICLENEFKKAGIIIK